MESTKDMYRNLYTSMRMRMGLHPGTRMASPRGAHAPKAALPYREPLVAKEPPNPEFGTVRHYCSLVIPHLNAYALSLHPDADDPVLALSIDEMRGFPRWFVDYAKSRIWGKQQMKVLPSAMRWYFKSYVPETEVEIAASFKPEKTRFGGMKPIRRRNRNPDDKTLQELLQKLGADKNPVCRCIQFALLATYVCGARTMEWYGARLVDVPGGAILALRNAKYNGHFRGNTQTRHLFFMGRENAGSVRLIKLWLGCLRRHYAECGEESYDTFYRFYNHFRQKLHKIQTRDRSGKQLPVTSVINLYSMRHAFAARMKKKAEALGYDRSWVAALMGHAVKDSAWRLYSDRAMVMGGNGTGPMPLTIEQAMVRMGLAERRSKALQNSRAALKKGDPSKSERRRPSRLAREDEDGMSPSFS